MHWPREMVDGSKLISLQATLERKSVRLKAFQQRTEELERELESKQMLRTRMEMRIAQLEHLVAELGKQALGKQCAARAPATR